MKIRNTQSSVGQVLQVFHLSDCHFYLSQTIGRVKFRTLQVFFYLLQNINMEVVCYYLLFCEFSQIVLYFNMFYGSDTRVVQDCGNPVCKQWRYLNLALSHRYEHIWYSKHCQIGHTSRWMSDIHRDVCPIWQYLYHVFYFPHSLQGSVCSCRASSPLRWMPTMTTNCWTTASASPIL